MTEQFLFDSNIHVDVFRRDPDWLDWSHATILACAQLETLVINPIIYAEIESRFETIADLDVALAGYERLELPYQAAFLAGKAVATYRRRVGTKTSPMPDFYNGAHALVSNLTFVTRDATRYRTYFPALKIIAPS